MGRGLGEATRGQDPRVGMEKAGSEQGHPHLDGMLLPLLSGLSKSFYPPAQEAKLLSQVLRLVS